MQPRVSHVYLLLVLSCQTGDAHDERTVTDCSDACWRIAAADCGDIGQECVNRCLLESVPPEAECAVERQQNLDCFWWAPAYRCDPELGTLPEECDAERRAVRLCLGNDGADAAADASATDADADQ